MDSERAVLPARLLFLPPSPSPATQDALAAAYDKPLTSVLKQLSSSLKNATNGSSLDIAVPAPFVYGTHKMHRSSIYASAQKLVAGVYRRICIIAAKESINVEDAEGIDVRILLLSQPRQSEPEPGAGSNLPVDGNVVGPVVDLQTLALCKRKWESIYSVESEECEEILKQFLISKDTRTKIQRVEGGIVHVNADSNETSSEDAADHMSHHAIAVGGTWDHLHIGHKLLLTMFAFLADVSTKDQLCALTIGITGDELLQNKKTPELLQSWSDRSRACSDFLRAIMDFRPPEDAHVESREINESGPNGHAIHIKVTPSLLFKCVEIIDPYGPTITDKSISALVVSAETRSGGKAVNDKRTEKNWPELQVFEVEVLDYGEDEGQNPADNDFKSKISSTSIRQSLAEKGQKRSAT